MKPKVEVFNNFIKNPRFTAKTRVLTILLKRVNHHVEVSLSVRYDYRKTFQTSFLWTDRTYLMPYLNCLVSLEILPPFYGLAKPTFPPAL